MSEYPKVEASFSSSLLRLQTMVRLRWLSVIGQLVTILLVSQVFDFKLPLLACLATIGLLVCLNIYLKVWYKAQARLPDNCAGMQLAGDILQLSTMLYLTGGLGNPFSLLLLAPVMIAAAAMPRKWTITLIILASLSAIFLAFYQMPLPWPTEGTFQLPGLYLFSVLVALVFSIGFMAAFGFRVAKESRQLAEALAATELVVAREQKLHALDGLAAAAAHELGTPLATIHLAAKELESELTTGDPRKEDIVLIRNQSDRCREILRKLTELSSDNDEIFTQMPVSQLLEEVIDPHRDFGVEINTHVSGDGVEPISKRNPAIHYGLGNLIENAVDFAKSTVDVFAEWNNSNLTIKITDDGPGFSSDILSQLGEPFLTSRSRSPAAQQRSSAGGLGLGVFIAKTLLERTGGLVKLYNQNAPKSGAQIEISWPRTEIDLSEKVEILEASG